MKNILIPSDFSLQSLAFMEDLMQKFGPEQLNIVFVHVFLLSNSVVDLMLLSRRRKEYSYISDQFWNQCKLFERRHRQQINSIKVECFYGSTVAIFKNYLEAHNIDLIVYPQDYQFQKLCKESFDPARLIAKSGKEILIIKPESNQQPVSRFTWIKDMSYQLSLN
jgi:hypothetical protein